MMQRLFTSGSRQAPDPYDQFLEQHNFYRKHTARDSSCLFRVISEQMYDTQIHHLEIRKQCVEYMRKHRNFFQNLVVRDIDEYLDDLAKPKTFGSLVELQALGFMFQRNVLLFEPYNLGNYFCSRAYFYKAFRVFYSPERHFDSVFPCEYITDIAICQAICYEILYKDLFMLPDVSYAVEKMLHGGAYESSESRFDYTDDGYASRVYLTNGRCFDLDTPKATFCILENYKLCHFHYTNFPRFTEDLQRELRSHANQSDAGEHNTMINRTFESLLPDKYVSCVRQLLREGITPFPYKVAKALDPSMYRNIEFDAWNEARKEQRMANWYNGDTNFKVGAKCHVRLKKSENDLYTCHIQEISMDKGYCVVFIEQLGEKRMVPYESLSPLPPEQFKPWTLPYRLQRHVRMPRNYNYHQIKLNGSTYSSGNGGGGSGAGNGSTHFDMCTPIGSMKSETWDDYDKGGGARHIMQPWYNKEACFYRLRQYTNLDNFQPPTMEYCTMPLTFEMNSVKQTENQTKANESDENNQTTTTNPSQSQSNPDLVVKTEAGEEQNISGSNTELTAANAIVPMHSEDGLVNDFENLSLVPAIPAMNMTTAAYMSDGCCYYGTYPSAPYYSPIDDYYATGGYSYDYPMNSGPVYYMYSSQATNYSYAPNMYITPGTGHAIAIPPANSVAYQPITAPAPPPTQNGAVLSTPTAAAPPTPALQTSYLHATQSAPTPTSYATAPPAPPNPSNTQYNNNLLAPPPPPALTTPNIQAAVQSSSSSTYNSPTTRNRYNLYNFNSNTTPTNGRINMEAKKSVKPNGIDLPQDINTLRFFYNLGVEYHKMTNQKKDKNQNDQQQQKEKEKLDENANSHDMIKSDANNNPTNYNNKSQYARRFNHRFFGSTRERTNNQRTSNSAANSNHQFSNQNRNQQQHQQQNDYNHNVINKGNYQSKSSGGGAGGAGNNSGGGAGNSVSTPNSSRGHLMSSSSGNAGSSVSSSRGLSSSNTPHGNSGSNEHITRASPLLNDNHSTNSGGGGGGGSSSVQTPNTYSNSQSGVGVGGGTYEQIGDGHGNVPPNMYAGPPPNTPSATSLPPPHFANGMFFPMGPPPPYGMYPPNGPPPQTAQTPGATMNGPNAFLQPPPTPTSAHYATAGTVPQYCQMPPPPQPAAAAGLLTANGMACQAAGNNTLYVGTPVGSDIGDAGNPNGLINADGSLAAGQQYYQPITYPPPGPPPPIPGGIPFFYPTMGAPNIHGNGAMLVNNTAQNHPGQLYWSQTPAPIPGPNLTPQPHSSDNFSNHKLSNENQNSNAGSGAGGGGGGSQASTTSNKRNSYNKANSSK